MLLVTLILIVQSFFKTNWSKKTLGLLTKILLFVLAGLAVSDVFLYQYWGYRMDSTAFQYLNTPSEVFNFIGLILPIRGGLGLTALNLSHVFFSTEVFTNHAAINLPWNIIYSLSEKQKRKERYQYMSEETALEDFKSFYPTDYLFGKDIFNPTAKSFANYTFNNGAGFASDSMFTIFNNRNQKYIYKQGKHPDFPEAPAKVYLQVLSKDYFEK